MARARNAGEFGRRMETTRDRAQLESPESAGWTNHMNYKKEK